eukprot:5650982-Ditylum_brightwellii.AAC.1
MKKVVEHVPFQLPNKFARVGFLLVGITSSDAGLQAVMATIKNNADLASETSKRHNFELTANFLQPFCSVLKKFPSGTKCDAINISDVSGSGFGTKPSAGKTGISLKYHTSKEYEALTLPQKDELQECQEEKSKSTKLWKISGHNQGRGQGGRGKSPGSK